MLLSLQCVFQRILAQICRKQDKCAVGWLLSYLAQIWLVCKGLNGFPSRSLSHLPPFANSLVDCKLCQTHTYSHPTLLPFSPNITVFLGQVAVHVAWLLSMLYHTVLHNTVLHSLVLVPERCVSVLVCSVLPGCFIIESKRAQTQTDEWFPSSPPLSSSFLDPNEILHIASFHPCLIVALQ